ncbi:MAG: hypothetical protein EOO99_09810 [Pedobacter sp.]|nr:MAG: hypothetical protein EOO99_09810 [Pedobacter sp.]
MERYILFSIKRLTLILAAFAVGVVLFKSETFAQNMSIGQHSGLSLVFSDFVNNAENQFEKCEGQILIKEGQLEDIQNLKFSMPKAILKSIENDTLVIDKKVYFEQSRVMILPLMGMIHLIGELSIDGIKTTADFHLSYSVNEDQSVSFKGSKLLKSIEMNQVNLNTVDVSKIKDDLTLEVDFKLNSDMNNMLAKK